MRRAANVGNSDTFLETRFEMTKIDFRSYPEKTFTTDALGIPKPKAISGQKDGLPKGR